MNASQLGPIRSAVNAFRSAGYTALPSVYSAEDIERAIGDIEKWSAVICSKMKPSEQEWYLEQGGRSSELRKLDQPVFHRKVFQRFARHPTLLEVVRRLIGEDSLDVCFSQVFMKPPEVGGPKPIHQDNFYFGPDDPDAMVTAWIALDDATLENGCLFYGERSHRDGVFKHFAPEGQPFNWQTEPATADRYVFTPAPMGRGGVLLHHGNTLHRSSANTSSRARRAIAIHYLGRRAALVSPALPYDTSQFVSID